MMMMKLSSHSLPNSLAWLLVFGKLGGDEDEDSANGSTSSLLVVFVNYSEWRSKEGLDQ